MTLNERVQRAWNWLEYCHHIRGSVTYRDVFDAIDSVSPHVVTPDGLCPVAEATRQSTMIALDQMLQGLLTC